MKVHANRIWGIVLILLAVSGLVVLFMVRGAGLQTGIGGILILLVIGIGLLNWTYFIWDRDNKTITIGKKQLSYERIFIEENKVYIENNNQKNKLKISKINSDPKEWNEFINQIGG